jgi:hypothetical protein
VANPLTDALRILKGLQSAVNGGVSYPVFASRVTDAKVQVDQLLSDAPDSPAKTRLAEALAFYVYLWNTWNAQISKDYAQLKALERNPLFYKCEALKRKSVSLLAIITVYGLQPLCDCASERVDAAERLVRVSDIGTRASNAESVINQIQMPGGVAEVTRQLIEARRKDPDAQLFPEITVSTIGQDYMRTGKPKLAVDVLKLVLLAYPESADANQTLAEAYLADAQKELARQHAEKALALLDSHRLSSSSWTDTEQYRGEIRRGAEKILKQLTPRS